MASIHWPIFTMGERLLCLGFSPFWVSIFAGENPSYGHVLDKSALYIHHALWTDLQAGLGRDESRPYERFHSSLVSPPRT